MTSTSAIAKKVLTMWLAYHILQQIIKLICFSDKSQSVCKVVTAFIDKDLISNTLSTNRTLSQYEKSKPWVTPLLAWQVASFKRLSKILIIALQALATLMSDSNWHSLYQLHDMICCITYWKKQKNGPWLHSVLSLYTSTRTSCWFAGGILHNILTNAFSAQKQESFVLRHYDPWPCCQEPQITSYVILLKLCLMLIRNSQWHARFPALVC